MSYTREQREANAAKAAAQATSAAITPELPLESAGEPAIPHEGGRVQARNEPRRLAMEEIEARHAKTGGNAPEEPVVEPAPANPVETPAVVETPKIETVDPVIPEPVVAETIKVKVDGLEFDAPKAEVEEAGGVKAYQMTKASENRLAKINQTLSETRKTQEQIAQWIQQNTPKTPTITDDQFIQSKVDIIRFGTPEESATALREVMERNNPQVNPQAITQMAVHQMRKESAVDNFKKEFHDVITNPMLMRLAVSLENERAPQAQQNQQTDWATFYRQIGNEVRSVTGRPSQPAQIAAAAGQAAATDPTSPVDKEARKASIVNLPTAAARAALPVESKPETREDILNQMRKTRGLATE